MLRHAWLLNQINQCQNSVSTENAVMTECERLVTGTCRVVLMECDRNQITYAYQQTKLIKADRCGWHVS